MGPASAFTAGGFGESQTTQNLAWVAQLLIAWVAQLLIAWGRHVWWDGYIWLLTPHKLVWYTHVAPLALTLARRLQAGL